MLTRYTCKKRYRNCETVDTITSWNNRKKSIDRWKITCKVKNDDKRLSSSQLYIMKFVSDTCQTKIKNKLRKKRNLNVLESNFGLNTSLDSFYSFLGLFSLLLQHKRQRHLHVIVIIMTTKVTMTTRKAMTSSK